MGLKAMITIDLNEVTESQKRRFNQSLGKISGFSKIKNLTTTWKYSCSNDKYEEVLEGIKTVINLMATDAEIKNYEAAVMIGDYSPEVL